MLKPFVGGRRAFFKNRPMGAHLGEDHPNTKVTSISFKCEQLVEIQLGEHQGGGEGKLQPIETLLGYVCSLEAFSPFNKSVIGMIS